MIANRATRLKVTLLPGSIIYCGIAGLFVSNSYNPLAALPLVLLMAAGALLLDPLIDEYCGSRQIRARIAVAYHLGFLRFYLEGPLLRLAYAYTYSALSIFGGGIVFLIGYAFSSFVGWV